jgi:imidazolonepropionase-like amidohydrolase
MMRWLRERKAAGLLDLDAGEVVRPGILRIDGDRIAGIGGPAAGEILDLGELILLPGLMDMEVNLLMGGRGETAAYSPVQDDPPLRVLRAVGNARRTLRAGFTTVRNLGLFVKTGGYLLDVALAKAIDAGWIDGPRVVPAGHAITPTGGHLDPTMFAAFAPGRAAALGGGGHRRRGRPGAPRRPVPDQARREADQGVRLGRGHVAHRAARRAALLRRGTARDHGRGAPARPAGRGTHARR